MTRSRVDERPFVAVRNRTYPCVVLWRARKYLYVVEYDRGIRVNKISADTFDAEYDLLHPHINGAPVLEREYDVQEAARKYLAWGTYAGITEVAANALTTILNRKGNENMSNIETQVSAQGDAKIPPTSVTLGSALANAAKPKATKRGTTAEAKRPSKPSATAPTKKAEPKKPEPKKPEPKKPAPKKAEPKKEKLTTKLAKPKPSSAGTGRGRPSSLDSDLKIKVLVEGNPRREGGQGHSNWPIIRRYDGKTVGAYLAAGGRADNLRTDVARGHVKLVK